MAGSASHQHPHLSQRDRLRWLPPGGVGNGLDDAAGWVPLAEAAGPVAAKLLAELGEADVAAYMAPAPRPLQGHAPTGAPRWRLWVGASAFGRAEEIVRTVLPALLARQAS